jgi:hypothetical protein
MKTKSEARIELQELVGNYYTKLKSFGIDSVEDFKKHTLNEVSSLRSFGAKAHAKFKLLQESGKIEFAPETNANLTPWQLQKLYRHSVLGQDVISIYDGYASHASIARLYLVSTTLEADLKDVIYKVANPLYTHRFIEVELYDNIDITESLIVFEEASVNLDNDVCLTPYKLSMVGKPERIRLRVRNLIHELSVAFSTIQCVCIIDSDKRRNSILSTSLERMQYGG